MPIYEFRCEDCGHEFEELVFGRDECPPCPKCESEKTGKLMSACRARVATGASAPSGDGGGESASEPQFQSLGGGCSGCSGGDCSSCGSA